MRNLIKAILGIAVLGLFGPLMIGAVGNWLGYGRSSGDDQYQRKYTQAEIDTATGFYCAELRVEAATTPAHLQTMITANEHRLADQSGISFADAVDLSVAIAQQAKLAPGNSTCELYH